MKKTLLFVCVVLISVLVSVVGCDSSGDTPTASPTPEETLAGALPILKIGDTWIQTGLLEGIEYTFTVEVVGEDIVDGKDCYVIEAKIEPLLLGIISNRTTEQDKVTLDNVRLKLSGEIQGETYVTAITFAYEYSEPPFPYEVGKSWQVTAIVNATETMRGHTEQIDEWEETYTYEIEKMETITVPAGTFECFKIIRYDEDGPLSIYWRSDEVKLFNVKTYEYWMDGVSEELISYSVSD